MFRVYPFLVETPQTLKVLMASGIWMPFTSFAERVKVEEKRRIRILDGDIASI